MVRFQAKRLGFAQLKNFAELKAGKAKSRRLNAWSFCWGGGFNLDDILMLGRVLGRAGFCTAQTRVDVSVARAAAEHVEDVSKWNRRG